MERVNKIVKYDLYCKNCEHFEKEDWEDPCHECLQTPARQDSHKPLYFEEKPSSQEKHGL